MVGLQQAGSQSQDKSLDPARAFAVRGRGSISPPEQRAAEEKERCARRPPHPGDTFQVLKPAIPACGLPILFKFLRVAKRGWGIISCHPHS